MNTNVLQQFVRTLCLFVLASPVAAQTVAEHMQVCMEELGFSSVPSGSCFGPNTVEVDGNTYDEVERLGYFRLSDRVDGVVFCRDVDRVEETASFVAMIMHNRDTGKTCFLDAPSLLEENRKSVHFPSPTSNSHAEEYWEPATNCVPCHTRSPYIMVRTADEMARFGLMNNGHDQHMEDYQVVGANKDYVERANQVLEESRVDNSCADACHAIARNDESLFQPTLIDTVLDEGLMPPGRDSVYRWSNRDTPNASGDWETLGGVANAFPFLHCDNPDRVDARVVGRDLVYTTDTGFPDKLHRFNAKDGLACKNSDQAGKQCNNYQVRFLCNGVWTNWYDRDRQWGSGDWETTSHFSNLCYSPSEIEARTRVSGEEVRAYGTPDRLYRFSPGSGLACRHSDQPDGEKCNNYTVKFVCP